MAYSIFGLSFLYRNFRFVAFLTQITSVFKSLLNVGFLISFIVLLRLKYIFAYY